MVKNIDLIISAKLRIYRFDNNLKNHVLIEELEKKVLKNQQPHADTIKYLNYFLKSIKIGKKYLIPTSRISQAENINIDKMLKKRMAFEKKYKKYSRIKKFIFIIGSPRSGTSFLFNLLAYYNQFAYFTNISHFKWPLYNLYKDNRKFIHEFKNDILNIDTKKLRLRNDIVLPAEGEYLFDRSVKIYNHIKAHEYILINQKIRDKKNLKINIKKHALFFNKKYFLCKSPFNTFRMQTLHKLFRNSYFIHIYRNGYHVTESIEENGFKYFKKRLEHPINNPWTQYINHILKHKDKVKLYNIKYEDLIKNHRIIIQSLFTWLNIKVPTEKIGLLKFRDKRKRINLYPKNNLIEKYNSLLGY